MRLILFFIFLVLLSSHSSAQERIPNRNLDDTVRHKMETTLKEVSIYGGPCRRVLRAAKEYVVDYDFVDRQILIATYSSGDRKKGKLFLLNRVGDTSSLVNLKEAPEALFKSCTGQFYCVTGNVMYPVEIDTGKLLVRYIYDLWAYDPINEYAFAIKDRFYYKIADRRKFNISYFYRRPNDPKRYLVLNFDDKVTREYNNGNLRTITALGYYKGKNVEIRGKPPTEPEYESINAQIAHSQNMRHLGNKNAYAYLDQPLFAENDQLRAFDFRHKQICTYDLDGHLLESVIMLFDFRNVQRLEVVKDPVTNEYYLHRSDNPAQQTLSRINLQTGELGVAIPIEKPFISKLKVFDSEIFYLYQNPAEPSTQQLYVQRGF